MSADTFRRLAYRLRAIPGRMGLHEHRVFVVVREYAGAHFGDGSITETETELTNDDGQPPRVQFLNERAIALGSLADGAIEIGPLTPLHAALAGGNEGTDVGELQGDDVATGDGMLLRLVGPNYPDGALYRVTDVDRSKALTVTITARPQGTT